ncbi:ATP-binding cassette domain-containing protein [Coprothermobacter platensis]|uniref:ATP-binding cassette domain-containing protein n=1 Tax=Coprothermobacter platensis TaxID=108819 RepID=UPI00036368E3|nr:ATP-binding cassette domain-containing protein [Coprothermobacter platensis]
MIELKQISYGLEDRQILRSVSLSIPSGKFIALMGGNGAGKTTLAKITKGLIVPSSGSVVLDGRDISSIEREYQTKVGIVFQNPENQIVSSIVEEDVAFGPENLSLSSPEIAARVESSLKTVGLWDLRHRSVQALSGGQKQRLAIAGILALRPSYIIFDEATALLDPVGKHEVLNTALELSKSVGVLWITHDLREALMADSIYALREGEMIFSGSVPEFLSRGDIMEKANVVIPDEITLAQELMQRGVRVDWPITKESLLKATMLLSSKMSH